jgi:hypothetical protein
MGSWHALYMSESDFSVYNSNLLEDPLSGDHFFLDSDRY